MGRLPVLSGRELVSILKKNGFEVVRQKGSHVSMKKSDFRTVIPLHNELAKGTLLAILRQTGMTKDELEKLIK